MFGICTLGLSCLLPYNCIKDARFELERRLRIDNTKIFEPKGLRIEFTEKCCYRSNIKIYCVRQRVDVAGADHQTILNQEPIRTDDLEGQKSNESDDDKPIQGSSAKTSVPTNMYNQE